MQSATTQHHGPLWIGAGLGIILAAQIWPGVPVAAAIALIGCGATCVLLHKAAVGRVTIRHQRWRLCGSLLVYTALVGLAVGAELHLRCDVIFLADALLAVALLLSAVHLAFQCTDSASTW